MKENLQNYTQNRELSWLRFNQRVLSEATDETVPLLERLKFISIFTSNLDEFFMIRVGTLHDLSQIKSNHKDNKTGMNPSEQLEAIFRVVKPLINFRDEIYENVTEQLKTYGVHGLRMNEIEKKELKYLKNYFLTQINPILSPQIIDPHRPFPFLVNKNIYVGATLANDNEKKDAELFGIIPIPTALPEVIFLPGADIRYVFTSDVVSYFADTIFNSYKILESTVFSVTRNADISSADFMTRNMDKRVEVGCPIKDKYVKEKIMHFIEVQQVDNTKARIMRSDGTYRSIITSNEPIDNHTVLMNEAKRNAGNANSESKSFNPKDFIAEIKRKFG